MKKVKIIGVGCGGGNIVNHLSESKLNDVSLAVCDLDASVVERTKAGTALQLGTDGLGTGSNPDIGRAEAERKIADIRALLSDKPQMAFVVSCFGGGCGTGVAPVIARESKSMGITTIGIATLPFEFEGNLRYECALDGIREMAKNTDAMFLLNNQYVFRQHWELPMNEAFTKADELMGNVIKCIASFTETPERPKKKMRLRDVWRRIVRRNTQRGIGIDS
ncbi:MAG: hypothetical protein IK025_10580 [Bacteroidales bacterium]|nr:hypothetical protein [Bacteroidales bacterium]